MDDYILEIPNFLPENLCTSVVTRFENDSRKEHGYFSYPINGEIVQRDKQNTELMISGLEGWMDIQRIFTESVERAFNVYMEHLKTNFDYDSSCHVYDRELSQNGFYFTPFPVQRKGVDTSGITMVIFIRDTLFRLFFTSIPSKKVKVDVQSLEMVGR